MHMESDPHAVAICTATIGLAHSLGLKVVAEGVETAAQRALLCKDPGCDYLQGFLFSRPLPIEQFQRFASAQFEPVDAVCLSTINIEVAPALSTA